jgi:hypothetical protein
VAGLARGGETAPVGIGVAGGALLEGEADVFSVGFGIRHEGMTFLARNLLVRAGEREFGRGVTETRGRLPGVERVAAGAMGIELAAVFVAVAGSAVAGQAEIGAIQILEEDASAGRWRNIVGFVALVAGDGGVTAFERVAGLAVVEGFAVGLPMDELEIRAVVFGMAFGALGPGDVRGEEGGMQAAVFREALANLGVALEAFEDARAAAEVVALGAVGGAGKRLVRPGKLTGRNLCARGKHTQGGGKQKNRSEEKCQ